MPVHRVAMKDLESEIARIEETETITASFPSGDGAAIVFTEPKRSKRAKAGEVETR